MSYKVKILYAKTFFKMSFCFNGQKNAAQKIILGQKNFFSTKKNYSDQNLKRLYLIFTSALLLHILLIFFY